MSAKSFHLFGRAKLPLTIVAAAGYYVIDILKVKPTVEALNDVKLENQKVPGVISEWPSIQPSLQEIIDEAKTKLNLPQHKKKILNYYAFANPDPEVHGFVSSYSQIHVFLPDYLNISKPEQLTSSAIHNLIKLMEYDVDSLSKEDWLTTDGVAVLNSFLLSKRAKKFLITQASYSNFNNEYFVKHFVFIMVFMACLITLGFVEERFKGSFMIKIAISSLMVIPILAMFHLLSKQVGVLCESKALVQTISKNNLTLRDLTDLKDVESIDEEMLLGALEYYSKLFQRQKALARMFNVGFDSSFLVDADGRSLLATDISKKEVIELLQKVHDLVKKESLKNSESQE